jgi:DNA-binding PadR family transcriptional regulator
MVMAALSQRPRHVEAVSARTGFTIIEVEQALRRALSHGWIDGRYRLTDDGREQLAHARKQGQAISPLPQEPEEFYYPTSLRAPAGVSS